MSDEGPNRREFLRQLFAVGASMTLPKVATAQTSDATAPENPFLRKEGPKTYPYDHMPINPWPDPTMRDMFINSVTADYTGIHETNADSLSHVYYYDSDIDFSGQNYSGVPEIDIIDDHLINGEWAEAFNKSDGYLRSGALHKIEDTALKIRILSSLTVGLRWDGRDYDPRNPEKLFPFDNNMARELQTHIYNLSNSPEILKQIIPPELKDAFTKMTEPGSIFDQIYRDLKQVSKPGYKVTEEQALKKYVLTKILNDKVMKVMDNFFGSKPVPVILDFLPPEAQDLILGQFNPINTDPETASNFDKLAAQHFGENFMFVSYSNVDLHDMLITSAHEKLHSIQNQWVRDLEQGNIPDDDPRFPLAQLYALNEALYSTTDMIACNQYLRDRCDQTSAEYYAQPWEANAYSVENVLNEVLSTRYPPEDRSKTWPPPASKATPNP